MFDNLSEKLEKAFRTLKGKGSISEINVAQAEHQIKERSAKYVFELKEEKV